jgi:rare lipoprotein A
MVRHQAASLCLVGLAAADILFIGAAGMWPKLPEMPRGQIVVVPLEPPPPAPPETKPAIDPSAFDTVAPNETGVASWYGDDWQGRITASGQPFDDRKLTAAHRTLPLNTRVRVINLKTGQSVEVTITDRGPYTDGRVIDLSKAAAKKLGMVKDGLMPVRIENVDG